MGLSWQQGPLAPGAVGRFLTDQPLPGRLLFTEPARRRMRIRFGDTWIADSQATLLHEPGRYPVAYLPIEHVEEGVLLPTDRITTHRDLGATRWFTGWRQSFAEMLVARESGRTPPDAEAGSEPGWQGQGGS